MIPQEQFALRMAGARDAFCRGAATQADPGIASLLRDVAGLITEQMRESGLTSDGKIALPNRPIPSYYFSYGCKITIGAFDLRRIAGS